MSARTYTPAELEAAARTLGAAARAGDGWVAKCPAHEDRTPSLSLNIGENGRLLTHCHAGCDPAAVFDGLRAAGVLLNGDARPNGHGDAREPRIVATYDYTDERGDLLYQVLRYQPKDFRQRRPDGHGGWTWKLGDTRRVLYRLPEVLKAEEVILVEGEKDVDNLRKAGFVATTNPGGAGGDKQGGKKWLPAYDDTLAGRLVVILPDNDEQGRTHAAAVARSLRGRAASVKVVELPDLPPKGDVSDWLKAGRTADELRDLIAKAPEWQPANGHAIAPAGRVDVELVEERINDAARRCAGLLAEEVFMRGPLPAALVRVEEAPGVREADSDDGEAEPGVLMGGVRHARGSLVFAEPSPERVQFRLDDKARFLRFDARAGKLVAKSCPTALARRIIAAAPELGFKPCAGIVTVPLFVKGRIVTGRGYHAGTGLVLDHDGILPPIPEEPTRQQVRRARRVLLRPFRGYVRGGTREERRKLLAAILAAVLTAVLRPSLPVAPAILLDANQPASGKGKMGRALAMIASGSLPAIITEGHSEEEFEKRLASGVLSGAACLLLDNLQRLLRSSTLESGLTEGVATIRLFGRLTDTTVPCTALVILTANNTTMRADMLRRTLTVRIVVDTEAPELRRFVFDPYEEARRERPAIIAAALTVARAWWLARDTEKGREIRKTTLGSFEAWSDLVAGAVEWLTGTNPVSLIEERNKEDPGKGDERALVAELHRVFGEAEWKAGEAAAKVDPQTWAGVVRFKGEKPTGREVGGWLRARRDRVFGRFALRSRVEPVENVTLWKAVPARGSDQEKPGSGVSDATTPGYVPVDNSLKTTSPGEPPGHTGTHPTLPRGNGRREAEGNDKTRKTASACPGMSRHVPAPALEGDEPDEGYL